MSHDPLSASKPTTSPRVDARQPPDLEAAAGHYAAFLNALGVRVQDHPELEHTPTRVAQLTAEWTSSMYATRSPALSLFDAPELSDWVIVRALPFYSMCEHHMVPFFGHIDVLYMPQAKIVGFGGIARLIRHLSHKPQLQERLGADLADALMQQLAPHAVLVRIEARQMCMELRGEEARCVSFATRGGAREGALKREALRLLEA